LHVFVPIFSVTVRAPEVWDLHYKIRPVSDRVAKFHGDRPREL